VDEDALCPVHVNRLEDLMFSCLTEQVKAGGIDLSWNIGGQGQSGQVDNRISINTQQSRFLNL